MHAVVVVGAARSGTNMLRDLLTGMPGFCTWPCDEINYIWRHGNRSFPTDELRPEHARPEVRKYIRKQFEEIARQQCAETVVEKTCANSLRLEFVDRVLPTGRYIFVTRDGRDVVASALRRWKAPLDLRYTLAKARYVPLIDVPFYASRYALNRFRKLVSRDRRLAAWGPRFAGMQDDLAQLSLPEVAARQWARSVERSLDAFATIEPSRAHRVQYERFVENPTEEFTRIMDFLGVNVALTEIVRAVKGVSRGSVGKWKRDLDSATMNTLRPHLEPTLEKLGYV